MAEHPNIDVPKLRRAILAYLDRTGKSRRGLSMDASDGRNPDLVRDIFRVDKRMPLYDNVAALASAMGEEVSAFVAVKPQPAADKFWLTVAALVEAGSFRSEAELDRDDWFQMEVEPYEGPGEQLGFIVRGRSMDRVFPEGTILHCVKLIGSGISFEPDDYVIVERKDGGLVETTVKKARRRRDGNWELVAESSLPKFRDPIFVGKPVDTPDGPGFDGLTDDETRVKALVLDAYLPLRRRRTRPMPDEA